MLNIYEAGECLINNFEKERFLLKQKNIFDPIKRIQFKNFCAATDVKATSTNKQLQDSKDITKVQQSFMLATQREFDLNILSSHEILYYSKYLFDSDGFYRKCVKSILALEIENNHDCGNNTLQDIISCLLYTSGCAT